MYNAGSNNQLSDTAARIISLLVAVLFCVTTFGVPAIAFGSASSTDKKTQTQTTTTRTHGQEKKKDKQSTEKTEDKNSDTQTSSQKSETHTHTDESGDTASTTTQETNNQTTKTDDGDVSNTSTQTSSSTQTMKTEDGTGGQVKSASTSQDKAGGQATSTKDTASTTVTTGDAAAHTQAENTLNTNKTDNVNSGDQTSASTTSAHASTTHGTHHETSGSTTHASHATTSVRATNTAEVVNTATTTAKTGTNTASGDAATVETGDAAATAHVVNTLNTNLVNSSGLIKVLKTKLGQNGEDIDLRDYSFFQLSQASSSAVANKLDISTENIENATNTILVKADTGHNTASGTSASIKTGDATAVANIVNLANANIVNSKYLLLSFNNVGDWNGDLVFPKKETFTKIFQSGSSQSASTTVTNTNVATTTNNVQVSADTGDNKTQGASTTVTTGPSSASANVVNIVNHNVTAGNAFQIFFRVQGEFSGGLYNAPAGVTLTRHGADLYALSYNPEYSNRSGTETTTSKQVHNNNATKILNNIRVSANTGGNTANGDQSSIQTGNAYAGANLINAANINVLGQNWMTAIVNVFGDWSGGISFGQPDLWVGGRADISKGARLLPGTDIQLTYDIINRGDVPAHDVALQIAADDGLTLRSGGDRASSSDTMLIPVGDVPAGETVQATADIRVADNLNARHYKTAITAEAQLYESDHDLSDNTETIKLTLNRPGEASEHDGVHGLLPSRSAVGTDTEDYDGSKKVLGASDSDQESRVLSITHDAKKGTTTATSTAVTYTMKVTNNSEKKLFSGAVVDEMTNDNGELLNKEVYLLEEIFPEEEIKISYTTKLKRGTTAFVNNSASVRAESKSGETLTSNTATSSVNIPAVAGRKVVRTQTCAPYMRSYVWPNKNNDAEAVRKLQKFLIRYEGADIAVTGSYNQATRQAVRDFQQKYADAVLQPWGITQATGNVYRTTVRKINDIACDDDLHAQDLRRLETALRGLQAALPGSSQVADANQPEKYRREEVAQQAAGEIAQADRTVGPQ